MPTNTVTKEMGLSHREFFNILPRAMKGRNYIVHETGARVADGDRHVEIVLTPEGRRNLSSISIPVTIVKLCFFGYDESETTSFLHDFDLHFRRGGG